MQALFGGKKEGVRACRCSCCCALHRQPREAPSACGLLTRLGADTLYAIVWRVLIGWLGCVEPSRMLPCRAVATLSETWARSWRT